MISRVLEPRWDKRRWIGRRSTPCLSEVDAVERTERFTVDGDDEVKSAQNDS